MIAKTLRNMGYDETIRVAALCAAETISEKIPESMDAAELSRMKKDGLIEFEKNLFTLL